MSHLTRRSVLGAAAAGGLIAATSAAPAQGSVPQPLRGDQGGSILGPSNPSRQAENPDVMAPPPTDHGSTPNLKWSFADSHMRLEHGGWARQTTVRELAASKAMAGVNMRLNPGGVRELHWHKEAEWSYILKGTARITAVDQQGRTFQDDVKEGDLWYFPSGTPHSIQGLDPDGTEFLLVFDDGSFNEDSTFLITDLFAHLPREVLAKNFGLPVSAFDKIPEKELYIFEAPMPGPLASDKIEGAGPVPRWFSHRMTEQAPTRVAGGTMRITDSSVFPASITIAAALVEIEPGGMREVHWHPNSDEWQFYIEGQGRMTVFAAEGNARTFDYQGGDVGIVPQSQPHYIENTGSGTLKYLELFRSSFYEDVSLKQWVALTPPELVAAHLHIDPAVIKGLSSAKPLVVAG